MPSITQGARIGWTLELNFNKRSSQAGSEHQIRGSMVFINDGNYFWILIKENVFSITCVIFIEFCVDS